MHPQIPVFPGLMQNADMPGGEDLSADIRLVARRNGVRLRPDQ